LFITLLSSCLLHYYLLCLKQEVVNVYSNLISWFWWSWNCNWLFR